MAGTRGRGNKERGAAVHGMLLLDKADGRSSNHALQQAKGLLRARKGGHTGSLDPIATGLLLLCFGETTKICGLFLGADKGYSVSIGLGVATDSGDRAGNIVRQGGAIDFSAAQLEAALQRFRGEFQQLPPMYSALKRDGQPLYKLARAGITVPRQPRRVVVYDLGVDDWRGDTLDLRVRCSRGFYIRALAADLGEALGCGAHVRELRRTSVGDFSVDAAVSLSRLEAMESPQARRAHLLPTEQALAHLPTVNMPDAMAARLRLGQAVPAPARDAPASGLLRVYSAGGVFLGLAENLGDGKITPRRLFNAP